MNIMPYTNTTQLEITWPIEPNPKPSEDSFIGDWENFTPLSGPELEFEEVNLERYQDILDDIESIQTGAITEIDIIDDDIDEYGNGTVTAHVTIGSNTPFVLSEEDLNSIGYAIADQLMDEDAVMMTASGIARGEYPYVNTRIDGWYDTKEWVDEDWSETINVKLTEKGKITVKILKETKTESTHNTFHFEFEIGDRVKQTYADPYNVGTILDRKYVEGKGTSYKVRWDYSDGPDIEWLPIGEPLSPYTAEV